MSAIASFYVVPEERLPDILAAATPQHGGWFRGPRDDFWPLLRAAARGLKAFDRSGWIFNTLDLYLESRHGFMIDKFGDAAATPQLAAARGSYWVVFQAAGARGLLATLGAIALDPADVAAFVVEEHGPDGAAEETEAVQAALAALKCWLQETIPGTIGLHSVG